MAPVIHPQGTADLAKRVIQDMDRKAAVELCRRLDGREWTFVDMIERFFHKKLTGPLFDVLADAWSGVELERRADAGLDIIDPEGAPA